MRGREEDKGKRRSGEGRGGEEEDRKMGRKIS